MHALIIGCGYLGERVANRWLSTGVQVSALTRSEETARRFESRGIQPIVGDVLDPVSLRQLPTPNVLLYAVGHDRRAIASKREVYVDGLKNTLALLDPPTSLARARHQRQQCQVIYISSSSVYGQSQGEWVDEQSPCEPTSEGGQICLDAERLLAGREQTTRLRLSGIYGPGRLLARSEQLRQGLLLDGNPDAWLNLIHIDDAVDAVLEVAQTSSPAPLYVVSDDEPITRRAYYNQLAAAVSAPPPRFAADASETTEDASVRESSLPTSMNKRCCNNELRKLLGRPLRFPSMVSGIPHAVAGDVPPVKESP